MSEANISFCHGNLIPTLALYLRHNSLKNLLIISSEREWNYGKAVGRLMAEMPEVRCIPFHDFTPNPTLQEVLLGCKAARQSNCDAIVAIGGGTAMDIAKSVSVFMHLNKHEATNAIQNPSIQPLPKTCQLIAIPTTAGSGSEATQFAAIYINGKKYSLSSPSMMPDLSLVDGTMSYSTPQYVAASCALDALCQAIESYWAVEATASSKGYALKAMELLVNNIEDAVVQKESIACNVVAEAATLAGKAINLSKTTAAHAYSYYLTSRYGIPHGHAVGLCLAAIAQCNFESQDTYIDREELQNRFQQIFTTLKVENIQQFVIWFKSLMKAIGLETSVKALGFNFDEEMQSFISAVNIDRLQNNPAKIDAEMFKTFFRQDL